MMKKTEPTVKPKTALVRIVGRNDGSSLVGDRKDKTRHRVAANKGPTVISDRALYFPRSGIFVPNPFILLVLFR